MWMIFVMLLTSLSVADGFDGYYQLKSIQELKKACIQNTNFCFEETLTYPDLEILDSDKLVALAQYIDKAKKDFEREDPKEEIKDLTPQDIEYQSNWYSHAEIKLYNYKNDFTTIQSNSGGYMGGAHGSYAVSFDSYKGPKKIELKDIYAGNKEGFYRLAEKIYREQKGLFRNESLQHDGWFDDKFVLADNFALRDDSIMFLYNPYEIKSYADGITTFEMPYHRLKRILGKDSVLYPLIDDAKKPPRYLSRSLKLDNGNVTLGFDSRDKILSVSMSLNKSYKNVWLSLSLPQFTSKGAITYLSKEGFESVNTYGQNDKIYNKKAHRALKAKYLLIEGEAKNSEEYQDYAMSFKINQSFDELVLYIRVVAKDTKRKTINLTTTANRMDQQGFESATVIFGGL